MDDAHDRHPIPDAAARRVVALTEARAAAEERLAVASALLETFLDGLGQGLGIDSRRVIGVVEARDGEEAALLLRPDAEPKD